MQKNFEVKIYGIDGTFKNTLRYGDRINALVYTANINGGQGECEIELDFSLNDTTYIIGNFIKLYVYSDGFPNGKLIYSGMIKNIERTYVKGVEKINLICIGYTAILSKLYFNQSGYTFTKNQDPAQTIKDLVNYYNTKYPGFPLSYSGGNIQNYGSSLNIGFDYTFCLQALQNIQKATNCYFFINGDGQVYFKPIPVTRTHKLTAGKHISSIDINEEGENIVNKYILNYNGGTYIKEDSISQTSYGILELKEDKTDIKDLASATIAGDNYINQNKNIKAKISIDINDTYEFIENILPGDTVMVKNLDYSILNLQIQKISYNIEVLKIELTEFDTISKLIFNN